MQKIHILSTDRRCLDKAIAVAEPAFSLVVVDEPRNCRSMLRESVCCIIDEEVSGEHTGALLRDILSSDTDVPTIVILAESNVEVAMHYVRLGAADCLVKPLHSLHLVEALGRVVGNRRTDCEEEETECGFVGRDRATVTLRRRIARVAARDTAVLIFGESGTGKEVVARAIHRLSPRRDHAFFAVNCSAIPESLFESELFGVSRGAYTGAVERLGVFAAAAGGTVFLDEIGELPTDQQAKLLRVIEEKVVTPLGSRKAIPVDFRLISATNRNLKWMLQHGHFRHDLYYRLNTAPLRIPPLRERVRDLWPLVTEYYRRQESEPPRFSREARTKLEAYTWPGNVRELYNVLERAHIIRDGEEVRGSDIRFDGF